MQSNIEKLKKNCDDIEILINDWNLHSDFDEQIYNNLAIAKEIDYGNLSHDELVSLKEIHSRIYTLEKIITDNKNKMINSLGKVRKHKTAKIKYQKNRQ